VSSLSTTAAANGGKAQRRHRDASLFVRVVMRPMTIVLNPAIRRIAGRKHMAMAAQIHHQGRRSGRQFVTPASARPTSDGTFYVPLTFGEHSDWCRNVVAAGFCTIRFKGVDHLLVNPVVLGRSEAKVAARYAFHPHERMMFRVLGITKFLRLQPTDTA